MVKAAVECPNRSLMIFGGTPAFSAAADRSRASGRVSPRGAQTAAPWSLYNTSRRRCSGTSLCVSCNHSPLGVTGQRDDRVQISDV